MNAHRSAICTLAFAAVLLGAAGAARASTGDRWIWPGPPGIASNFPSFYDVRRQVPRFLDNTPALWTLAPDSPRTWSPGGVSGGQWGLFWPWVYDPTGDRLWVLTDQTVPTDSCCGLTQHWAVAQLALAGQPTLTLAPVRGPTPPYRYGSMFVYDSRRARVLVIGGIQPGTLATPTDRIDVLDVDGDSAAWSGFAVSDPALPVGDAQAVYDSLADRVIVVGGEDSTRRSTAAWSLDLAAPTGWQRWAGTDSLDDYLLGKLGTRIFLDDARRRLLLTRSPGGVIIGGAAEPQATAVASSTVDSTMVWQLDLDAPAGWRAIPYAGPRPPINLGQVVYDPGRNRLTSYGSGSHQELDEVVLDGVSPWVRATQSLDHGGVPEAHAAWDEAHGRYLVVDPDLCVVWRIQPGVTDCWQRLDPWGSGPLHRHHAAVAFDPVGQCAYQFGGNVDGTPVGELWRINVSDSAPARWEELTLYGDAPSPRWGASAVYDPPRHRIVLFGGYAGKPLDDTWELRLDPPLRWRRLPDRGIVPPGRYSASVVYDSRRDAMILFGGELGATPGAALSDETWALSFHDGDAWLPLAALGRAPAPRAAHNAVYDPLRDRMIVFWGDGYGTGRTDCAELDLADGPAWRTFFASGPTPPTREDFGALYDPVRDRAVCVGGSRASYSGYFTTGFYADFSANPVRTPPPLSGPPLAILGLAPNPAQEAVAVAFDLPVDADVHGRIYDASGRLVRDLGTTRYVAGRHLLVWDGRNTAGAVPASGMYFARLDMLGRKFSGKFVLLH